MEKEDFTSDVLEPSEDQDHLWAAYESGDVTRVEAVCRSLGGCPRKHQANFLTYSCQRATRRG